MVILNLVRSNLELAKLFKVPSDHCSLELSSNKQIYVKFNKQMMKTKEGKEKKKEQFSLI